VFKGRQRSKSSHISQVQEGGHQVIWPEVLEKLNQMVESLQEEVSMFCEPWDLVEQRKDYDRVSFNTLKLRKDSDHHI
jgi:hypothetical protein